MTDLAMPDEITLTLTFTRADWMWLSVRPRPAGGNIALAYELRDPRGAAEAHDAAVFPPPELPRVLARAEFFLDRTMLDPDDARAARECTELVRQGLYSDVCDALVACSDGRLAVGENGGSENGGG